MTTDIYATLAEFRLADLEALRKRWGWVLALGIALIVIGAIACGSVVLMSLATMVFIGWLMILGGVLEAAHAFTTRAWSGFFVDLLSGVLYIVAGFFIVANPGASAVALTLVIAMYLILGGLFRIVMVLVRRFEHWPWFLLHGVVSLLLGIAIWRQWPLSGLWVIGLFAGIDLILNGWSLVMLAFAVRGPRNLRSAASTPAIAHP
jgi:uncharacterized membrane protein HdeD (DUF308 family)